MRSFLGVPVMGRGGRVFGNLYLTDKVGADAFDDDDETIAVLFASQAAVAIENARLNEEAAGHLLQIEALQRQRELFSAMINHELRNALTGVYGWSERAVRAKTLEASRHAADEVLDSAQRTIALLNNLLDLSRLDAGKVAPVHREFSVSAELGRVVSGLKPLAESRRIDLVLDGAEVGSIDTDPTLFQQIVSNLVTNAILHGPAGEPVVVMAERAATEVRVRVTDRGPGIPESVQARIFEPFERFDPESGKGSGLGLPIARRLAEVLGGSLTLESGTGRGTVFTLALPFAGPE
jgi:signal transduction histidine kinase